MEMPAARLSRGAVVRFQRRDKVEFGCWKWKMEENQNKNQNKNKKMRISEKNVLVGRRAYSHSRIISAPVGLNLPKIAGKEGTIHFIFQPQGLRQKPSQYTVLIDSTNLFFQLYFF